MISKEAVLTQAYAFWEFRGGGFLHMLPFLFCLLAAVLTAFYMFRLVIGIFYGEPRDHHAYDHAHESPKTMTIPLIVLATIGVMGAGIAFPGGPGTYWFEDRASPEVLFGGMMTDEAIVSDVATREAWAADKGHWHDLHAEHAPEGATAAVVEFNHAYHAAHWPTFFLATGFGLFGIAFAFWVFFYNRKKVWVKEGGVLDSYRTVLLNLYYVDDFYAAVPIAFLHWSARLCAAIDRIIVDGIVNAQAVLTRAAAWVVGRVDYHGVDGAVRGTGEAALELGRRARKLQNGKIQDYVGLTVYGMALVFLVLTLWVLN
jgi:NADH-quinone oxidoreductase subunit L